MLHGDTQSLLNSTLLHAVARLRQKYFSSQEGSDDKLQMILGFAHKSVIYKVLCHLYDE